jgi:hypothetical protein
MISGRPQDRCNKTTSCHTNNNNNNIEQQARTTSDHINHLLFFPLEETHLTFFTMKSVATTKANSEASGNSLRNGQ